MEILAKHTRFRAYQLKSKGSSFSYFNGAQFVLGEARYNDDNKASILHELKVCNKTFINVLHITSWDSDHCASTDLEAILNELKPRVIEYPGHEINKQIQNQIDCLKLITDYVNKDSNTPKTIEANCLNSQYISELNNAIPWSYNNIIFNNDKNHKEENNNSNVKLFKSGNFSVLSLGDLEKKEISTWLSSFSSIKKEVDVMLLAHHGSDNGFTSTDFLDAVKPKVAISLSNWDNQHNHPSDAILQRLRTKKIDYYSTKQGDLIIESTNDHTRKYAVWNFIANGEELKEAPIEYKTKRASQETIDKLTTAIKNMK